MIALAEKARLFGNALADQYLSHKQNLERDIAETTLARCVEGPWMAAVSGLTLEELSSTRLVDGVSFSSLVLAPLAVVDIC